jgi:hypothetical protein
METDVATRAMEQIARRDAMGISVARPALGPTVPTHVMATPAVSVASVPTVPCVASVICAALAQSELPLRSNARAMSVVLVVTEPLARHSVLVHVAERNAMESHVHKAVLGSSVLPVSDCALSQSHRYIGVTSIAFVDSTITHPLNYRPTCSVQTARQPAVRSDALTEMVRAIHVVASELNARLLQHRQRVS